MPSQERELIRGCSSPAKSDIRLREPKFGLRIEFNQGFLDELGFLTISFTNDLIEVHLPEDWYFLFWWTFIFRLRNYNLDFFLWFHGRFGQVHEI